MKNLKRGGTETVYLPYTVRKALLEFASAYKISRNEVIKQAVIEFLKKRKYLK